MTDVEAIKQVLEAQTVVIEKLSLSVKKSVDVIANMQRRVKELESVVAQICVDQIGEQAQDPSSDTIRVKLFDVPARSHFIYKGDTYSRDHDAPGNICLVTNLRTEIRDFMALGEEVEVKK